MKNDSGRSMVELLAYVAIAAVMAAGMFKLYSDYSARANRAAAQSLVASLAEDARRAVYGKRDFYGPLNARLVGLGRSLADPWGGEAAVSAAKCVEVELKDIARGDCIHLVRQVRSDCKGAVTLVNGAELDSCSAESNSVKWFFSRGGASR
jgi:type II secretory pathway pseudopilin PulG